MLDVWNDLTPCCSIGAQLVSDDPLGRKALSLQEPGQQTSGRLGVAAVLGDLVEHLTILIDSPPQPALPAVDAHRDLVEVPDITAGRWLSANAPGIVGTMFSAPSADGLIGDSDPTLKQHFLNVAQTERKPIIEPDGAGNNLWRETVVLVIGNGLVHAETSIDNLLSQKQCDSPLEAPLRQIAENAGAEGSIVVGTLLKSKKPNHGFNAQTELYVDMIEAGIVDPAKVVRTALQDAGSIAGLLITAEALIADVSPIKETSA
jgi:hypothetical protein